MKKHQKFLETLDIAILNAHGAAHIACQELERIYQRALRGTPAREPVVRMASCPNTIHHQVLYEGKFARWHALALLRQEITGEPIKREDVPGNRTLPRSEE